ncbi:peptidoglycan amidohydrolase family protein, partial [Limosilactobacillus fermentum]
QLLKENTYRVEKGQKVGYLVNSNGNVLSGVQKWMGTYYYFDPSTYLLLDHQDYVKSQWGDYYMVGSNGALMTGLVSWQGSKYYFNQSSYLLAKNTFSVPNGQKVGYLSGSDGKVLSGVQKWMGTYYYFDPSTNLLLDHQDYVKSQWGYYYMVGSNGALVTGPVRWQGSLYYFDPSSYLLKTSGWAEHNHYVYYVNSGDQKLVTGTQTIGGVRYTFDSNGALYSFTRRTIEWFLNREGKLTYSMLGSRNGTDGTADFSGAMTQALRSAGASAPVASAQRWGGYNTISIRPWLIQNGYSNVFNGTSSTASSYSPQYGDIVIWDDATGGDGHILIIADGSGSGATALSVCYYTEGEEGTAVQELNYNYYYNYAESPSFHVYRPNNWLRA